MTVRRNTTTVPAFVAKGSKLGIDLTTNDALDKLVVSKISSNSPIASFVKSGAVKPGSVLISIDGIVLCGADHAVVADQLAVAVEEGMPLLLTFLPLLAKRSNAM
jgi:hypothetical protein